MKKLATVLILSLGAMLITSGYAELIAQGKKPSTSKGSIELVHSKDGKYRFTIRNSEGKYLAGSPVGHETEKEAREVVEELKRVLATANYVSKQSDAGKDKDK